MRHPEGLIVIGPLAFGCRDRAFIEGSGVMREGRREVYWTQEHIDLTEVAAPGGSGRHTAVLLVDDFRERREVLTRLLKGEEQPHVKTERFVVPLGVHSIGPAFDYRRTRLGECVHSIGYRSCDLVGDRALFVVEHYADTKILQPCVAWWRHGPGVGLRRLALGPAGDTQGRPKIVCGPAERATADMYIMLLGPAGGPGGWNPVSGTIPRLEWSPRGPIRIRGMSSQQIMLQLFLRRSRPACAKCPTGC